MSVGSGDTVKYRCSLIVIQITLHLLLFYFGLVFLLILNEYYTYPTVIVTGIFNSNLRKIVKNCLVQAQVNQSQFTQLSHTQLQCIKN